MMNDLTVENLSCQSMTVSNALYSSVSYMFVCEEHLQQCVSA